MATGGGDDRAPAHRASGVVQLNRMRPRGEHAESEVALMNAQGTKSLTVAVATVVAILVGVVVLPSVVNAHGGDGNLMHVCVTRRGVPRFVQPTLNCRVGETAVHWALSGPAAGPVGPQGPQGPPRTAGPTRHRPEGLRLTREGSRRRARRASGGRSSHRAEHVLLADGPHGATGRQVSPHRVSRCLERPQWRRCLVWVPVLRVP